VTDSSALIAAIVQQMNVGLFTVDEGLRISHWNRFMEIHSGRPAADLLGTLIFDAFPETNRQWLERKLRSVFELRNFSFTSWRERPYLVKFMVERPATGATDFMRQDCTFIALREADTTVKTVAIVLLDATENYLAQQALDASMVQLRQLHERLQREVDERQVMEVELRNAHRLQAVEHLAAGVAHEVNTPLQVISNASSLIAEGTRAALGLVEQYVALGRSAGVPEEALARLAESAELPFWRDELPGALARLESSQLQVGLIVSTLKGFTGNQRHGRVDVNVNVALQEAVQFARPRYETVADVELTLGEVPSIDSPAGALGQVFLSLIINAAHAIERCVAGSARRGSIRVSSRCEGDDILVAISDTGEGIPEAIRAKVFDLFFTTKAVGSGLGAGLALAYATVTKEHRGTLTFETEVGHGTTFTVRLPAVQG
jgi:two-component system NtrC family sensor kinase